jgi:allantoicase
MNESADEWRLLPDLASRLLGGGVVYANDEFFAEKENLVKPEPPAFDPAAFGHKGKVYDGWESRRRREPGHDHAIVRLGCPGIVHGVVVDTAFFRGNYPPEVSVDATCAEGYPSPDELAVLDWHPLVARSAVRGDAANEFAATDRRRWSHVRLSIYPDGGVARFRVHGEVVADPAFLSGIVDLAAMENGGMVTDCSDAFYSAPSNLILPGRPRVMSDGWENARRRGPGNDFVAVRLAGPGVLRWAEIDTTYFVGNAPGWITLSGQDPDQTWRELIPRTRVQPDTRHRLLTTDAGPVSAVRLDVIPDGGLARLRIHGELTAAALDAMRGRWRDTAPH